VIQMYPVMHRHTKAQLLRWVKRQFTECGFPNEADLSPSEFDLRVAADHIAWTIRTHYRLKELEREGAAEVARKYLQQLGFRTVAMGVSWGVWRP